MENPLDFITSTPYTYFMSSLYMQHHRIHHRNGVHSSVERNKRQLLCEEKDQQPLSHSIESQLMMNYGRFIKRYFFNIVLLIAKA